YAGSAGEDVTLTATDSGLAVTKARSGSGTVTSDVGAINCPGTCSDTYATGTVITLTAIPAGGSQFTGWLGACTGKGTCRFTINGATTAMATFAPALLGAASLSFNTATSCVLDIDGNGQSDALTDGLLIIRYLF